MFLRSACLLAAGLLAGGATVWAAEGDKDKPRRTLLGEAPWVPSQAQPQPKVIYGADDRIDLYQESDPARRAWAAATCGLFNQGNVQNNGDGTFTLRTFAYNVCADEPFSNQPTSAFCSGFMVGPDLIATAGHCFDSGDIGRVRFVFGFVMENANTPVVTVDASQVYTGVELVGRALSGNLDYSVVRVDRAITSPGATPFELRREGVVPVGANVGVIGHPSGLPLKLAFGDNTVVRSNSNSGFFVANLDTYAGNSGSPVIDPNTGRVEGILVRGEVDFVTVGGCSRSNVVSDTGGRGEDVSKSTTFAQFVPELGSTLRLDRTMYPCGGPLEIYLNDRDLAGQGAATVDLMTSGGDMESFSLAAVGALGEFAGSVTLVDGDAVAGNGVVEIRPGDTITVTYADAMHAPGAPDVLEATAGVDCVAPTVSGVTLGQVGTEAVSIFFSTDEAASGQVRVGTACGSPTSQSSFILNTEHAVTLQGLQASTTYFFFVEAYDAAGNETVADNGGACFSFTTADSSDYVTEYFPNTAPDLVGTQLEFTPTDSGLGYTVCRKAISALPVSTSGATALGLSDDGSALVGLTGGASFPFFGASFTQFFVNANGNITFNGGDGTFAPDLTAHFLTRRISLCFSDLNPAAGGVVNRIQLADKVVVTWLGVPHFQFGGANSMQLEMFFNGVIRFSYTNLNLVPAVVGLSNGLGLPSDFTSTDFSGQAVCGPLDSAYHSADQNRDRVIGLSELLRVIQFVNLGGYHCDLNGEDGYGAGPGPQNCIPHDSDYNPQDWAINLTEILRLVQFFNVGGYTVASDSGSEDGFEPLLAR